MSVAETTIAKPKRWDEPFGPPMPDESVARLLRVEPFSRIDRGRFPPNLSLEGIVRNDMRIVEFEDGDLIVREGDYGNSAFMVLHGQLRVALAALAPELIGHPPEPRKSWWKALSQLWGERQIAEVRRNLSRQNTSDEIGTRGHGQSARVFLQDVPRVLDSTRTATIEAGEFFGELAALSRTPRTATVFSVGKSVLLEIRWQGLRDLMRRTPSIQQHIDQLYRANSLRVHLRETPLLEHLPDPVLSQIAEVTEFESFGSFDWHLEQAKLAELSPLERMAREPAIAEEQQALAHVLLIRSGFARLARRYGEGQRTLAYLGKGEAFGLDELLDDRGERPLQYQSSLRAVGHVDVLKIPVDALRELVLPTLDTARRESLKSWYASTDGNRPVATANDAPAPLVDFLVDERLINGTQAMVIDLERCTRCDDCVRACATTHDGNPRFVRNGPQYGQFQFAGACMHCVDPVCMIGCPTGAIHRDTSTGVVRINDNTCIGCATCAGSCPYSNIRMVEIHDAKGSPVIDLEQSLPIVKATKCDLCAEQLTGPACQNACAHDALVRIELADLPTVLNWMER